MPSPSIPCSSSVSLSSAPPNFSNFGRLSRGLPRPQGVAPSIPNCANNRPKRFIRILRRKIISWKRSTNNKGEDFVEIANPRRTTLENIQFEEKQRNVKFPDKICSPYYRGLLPNLPTQCDTERAKSLAAGSTGYTKASRTSSFSIKLQAAWGSCLLSRSKKRDNNRDHEDNDNDDDEPRKATTSTRLRNTSANAATAAPPSSSFVSVSSPVLLAKDMIKKEAWGNEIATSKVEKEHSNSEKKPLRECITTSGPAEAVPLPDQPIISQSKEVDPVDRIGMNTEQEKKPLDGEREFLWADKYRPKFLEDFICNRSKAMQLLALARKADCGHLVFHGPPGVGKRTMIRAMFREAFGPDSVHGSEEYLFINVKDEIVRRVKVLAKVSPSLVEVNISDLKGYEKQVIFELIKEPSDLKISNKPASPCKPPDNCRAIIFYGVDKLSTDAILYVKWLLERYKVCNKIFFCCTDVSKLQAIKDLCTVVQLLPPSRTEIIEVLKFIADKEGIELPHQLAEKITDTSKNNLRQAIRSFEATWLKHYPFKEDQQVLTGWEDDIANIAKNMVHEQSPKLLYDIRGKLQHLIDHEVSPEFIFQSLVDELKKHLHNLLKHRVHDLYVEYSRKEENVFETDKAVAQAKKNNIQTQFLRIEEFIAKFMSCYKAESAKIVQREQGSDDQNIEV